LKTKNQPAGLQIIPFASAKKWQQWLAKNHSDSKGLLIKIAKKDSGIASVTIAEALENALCYGWIDGQRNSFDDKYYLQKFTPRGAKSIWSKINCGFVEKLIADKKMQPAGHAAIEAAKKDGRWDAAYDSPKNMKVPDDFLKALTKNKKAETFFNTLNKTNKFAIAFRLHTAKKPETREKRINAFLKMMTDGEKLH
jgi:uncharacterized protein YdeI (YjbR/CyaY-like superfamily)